MVEPVEVATVLREFGFSWYSGVPCSYLRPFLNYLGSASEEKYFGAASEGEALGIGMGAYLAGRRTVVMCQNSGLGNMVNPLTSMNFPFRIPSLLFVTWRGQASISDEPQHSQMGSSTIPLLEALKVPWRLFPQEHAALRQSLQEAAKTMDATALPFCLIVPRGTWAHFPAPSLAAPERIEPRLFEAIAPAPELTRRSVLETVLETLDDSDAIVSTTGMTSRELYTIADQPNNFYVIGSMGAAAAVALGITTVQSNRRVIVLDGDGALLMRLGTLATVGFYHPSQFIHVVLDNEAHDSTGGQRTASSTSRFARMAAAANYASACSVSTQAELIGCLKELRNHRGPGMLHVKIRPGVTTEALRPKLSPIEIKERFISFLSDHAR
jgi:phosphonopyruvate decarboxylase